MMEWERAVFNTGPGIMQLPALNSSHGDCDFYCLDYFDIWKGVFKCLFSSLQLKCCGVKNYTDFSGSSFERVTGHTYPRCCCKSPGTVDCDGHNVSADVIHQEVTGDFEESACNAGDLGSIPESGRSPGGGHGNPLQYSRLENPMDRGAWWAALHGIASRTPLINWAPTQHRHHLGRPWGPETFFLATPRG